MGRHGEGVHNVAEDYYGTAAWDDYWSKLEGNDTVTWADAHLTEKGTQQAQKANAFWATEVEEQKIPVPEKYYTSPLHRCLATANVTFSGLQLPAVQPFIPEVKELMREVNGVHTCDRRSSKTYINAEFPTYTIEDEFAENDKLWSPDIRESDPHMDARLKTLLDDIFAHDDSTYISFTGHSGATSGLLRILGHRAFRLSTGGVIPVLVKAEMITR
jgi:broad specificity phosphatase PhoE